MRSAAALLLLTLAARAAARISAGTACDPAVPTLEAAAGATARLFITAVLLSPAH